jgi:hypothetical protein
MISLALWPSLMIPPRACRTSPNGGDAVGVRKRQRALLLGFEQPHVFDRDHRLVGEGLDKRDLLVAERSDLHSPYQNDSNGGTLAQQRRRKRGPMALGFRVPAAYRSIAPSESNQCRDSLVDKPLGILPIQSERNTL